VWLHLGFASCALRTRHFDDAVTHARRARSALAALPADYDDARIELVLVDAYTASRIGEPVELDPAAQLLATAVLADDDRACFEARLADHRAYHLNRAGDYRAALALYESIPANVHPFASYRREAGRAYGTWKLGDRDAALVLARTACDYAGDGGYTRLRAMGLLMIWKISGDDDARARARAIADRLGDDELRARASR
jgi:TPR repeat protein